MMRRRHLPSVVVGAALIERVNNPDALTILTMMFMSHQREPFKVSSKSPTWQARIDMAMARLCAIGCVDRLESGKFRIVEQDIKTMDECIGTPLAVISPTWGHA